jgi:hypothetical protein
MQGEVSRIGGTEAGVFPKYKNDIKYDQLNYWLDESVDWNW